ncbi:hypothetical protein [Rubritalea tangerina]|uniref:hypothetical protein n=1 Tax=Rubritalea tangerina TaxID=430798 RepID=UPI0036136567
MRCIHRACARGTLKVHHHDLIEHYSKFKKLGKTFRTLGLPCDEPNQVFRFPAFLEILDVDT